MADAYGIRVSSSKNVAVRGATVEHIRSASMNAFGVGITGSCEKVGVNNADVDASTLQVGRMENASALERPYLKGKAMPFYRESGQSKVGFENISPEDVFVAPEVDCQEVPPGEKEEKGCPLDGDWEVTNCFRSSDGATATTTTAPKNGLG